MRALMEDSRRRRSCSSCAVAEPLDWAPSRRRTTSRNAARSVARSRSSGGRTGANGERAGSPAFGPQQQHPRVSTLCTACRWARAASSVPYAVACALNSAAPSSVLVLVAASSTLAPQAHQGGARWRPLASARRAWASQPAARPNVGPRWRNRAARPKWRSASKCPALFGREDDRRADARSAFPPHRAHRGCWLSARPGTYSWTPRSPSAWRACSSTNEARACHQGRRWARKSSRPPRPGRSRLEGSPAACAARAAANTARPSGWPARRRGPWRRMASVGLCQRLGREAGRQEHRAPVEPQVPADPPDSAV